MSAPFELRREADGALAASGELTFETAARALREITEALAGQPAKSIDLGGISHSDSAGLACILAAQAEALKQGRTLAVHRLPEGMRALAKVCEVESMVG